MANPKGTPENLVSFSEIPKEKHKEISSKGGKKSAEKAKKAKTYSEIAKAFLKTELSDEAKSEYSKKGIPDEMLTMRFAHLINLNSIIMNKNENGMVRIAAMKEFQRLVGESPDQMEAERAAQTKFETEDDPFSKSLKAMFGGEGK